MRPGLFRVALAALLFGALIQPLSAAHYSGKISGVVVDPAATPQLGATVTIVPEHVQGSGATEALTNDRGRFLSAALASGFYTVRVSLAGFLPAMEQHVAVSDKRTTLLQLQLGSVFSALDAVRQKPAANLDADEWTWVLRSSPATRPILRFDKDEVVLVNNAPPEDTRRNSNQPRGELEVTSGARRLGAASNFSDTPSSGFAYQQNIGSSGQLLMAGQFSYQQQAPAGGFATVWLPDGPQGPVTRAVLRQSQLEPDGLTFRGLRIEHDGQLAVTDRVAVRYGAQYLLASLGNATSSLRPRVAVAIQVASTWRADLILTSRPWSDEQPSDSALQAALDSLDAFPTLLLRNGHTALEGGWHEELAVEHSLGTNARFIASAFHDRSADTAVFGRGSLAGANVLPDTVSNAFSYDAGSSGSWGARAVYRQKFSDDLQTEVLYAWAGALAPGASLTAANIRGALETRHRQVLGAKITARIPYLDTQVATGYKWISGPAVSRVDPYGEDAYRIDPFLSFELRQPLPAFFSGRMLLVADFGNILAQGYVPLTTINGNVLLLPAYRTLSGGVSVKF
jgi:Carboxypeptidase regulatory-like domain